MSKKPNKERALAKQKEFICPKCEHEYEGTPEWDGSAPICPDCYMAYNILGNGKDAEFIEKWMENRIRMAVEDAVCKAVAELEYREWQRRSGER
jgi:5-formyltetrahydrofolate cyclo-ligase